MWEAYLDDTWLYIISSEKHMFHYKSSVSEYNFNNKIQNLPKEAEKMEQQNLVSSLKSKVNKAETLSTCKANRPKTSYWMNR